ncbi:unnamed protein product, partial [Brassica rapa subsp. trilocularis]
MRTSWPKLQKFGLSETGPYLDQTDTCEHHFCAVILKVLCGIPVIDPYISRER